MKAKTLLVAAAALAAATISSQAQVYSQNIVGYVNVVSPASQYILVANPLTTGNDVLTNVFTSVPGATQVQIWNPGTQSFTPLTYSGPAGNRHWKDGANVIQDNTLVPPGVGFFFQTTAAFTNTFVGSVVVGSGLTTTNTLTGSTFQLAGSQVPFGGSISNSIYGLTPGGGTQLQKWNSVGQNYTIYTYSGPAGNRTWKDGSLNVVDVQIGVGEGFFILPSANYNWVQTAP